ncbi:MAG TPA: ATP-binding protein [Candidatus Angelobacter sp.]|nr:ATP-binding protein [Candidatus Angelobacter sp.]
MNPNRNTWQIWNQQCLLAALSGIRRKLEQYAAKQKNSFAESESIEYPAKPADGEQFRSAMEVLVELFALSPFELDLLLMCAGVELEPDLAKLCSQIHGDRERTSPTFSLALATLPGGHWSALSPARPLRKWRLVEVGPGSSITLSPLRADERILNYLVGVSHPDERLSGVASGLDQVQRLVQSHELVARNAEAAWQKRGDQVSPVIQLCGLEPAIQRAIAARVATLAGLRLFHISAHALPLAMVDLQKVMRSLERECLLEDGAVLLDCQNLDTTIGQDSAREHLILHFMEQSHCPLILSTPERRNGSTRPILTLEVSKPNRAEQRGLWRERFTGSEEFVKRIVAQFDLGEREIQNICSAATAEIEAEGTKASGAEWSEIIWAICRSQSRAQLDDLAQRVESKAVWDDLVLPESQKRALQEIAVQVRHRTTVYEQWGFSPPGTRGMGISAMFCGASGTGKTMAAEALASELNLDLYRIDLSSVVSKYIGETEKNLRKVFDAAEKGGAILLFDEADALFGKRSEVKDSHDRYANIEVSYLLQRVESYRGLAILTTNLKEAVDQAFLRRIRFIVQFPFPDHEMRAEIWRRVFPCQAPVEQLHWDRLAQLHVAGANIRNIALRAAFLAAEAKEPISQAHLLEAARREYQKLEKPISEAELKGWS